MSRRCVGFKKAIYNIFVHWYLLEVLIHPLKQTWNLEMMVSNRNLLFQGSIFRFHVCFWGCNLFSLLICMLKPSCDSFMHTSVLHKILQVVSGRTLILRISSLSKFQLKVVIWRAEFLTHSLQLSRSISFYFRMFVLFFAAKPRKKPAWKMIRTWHFLLGWPLFRGELLIFSGVFTKSRVVWLVRVGGNTTNHEIHHF